ncbi:uncharacterized protein LOC110852293 [Folsomia candida]|uniref:uncharacterized protein LOC110852293 n=1 Tax=Folsomia candida TaxID=158441 RepID=UPI000B900457|nr:uncharacterized protein LOC110852293 [Folsomia candida]
MPVVAVTRTVNKAIMKSFIVLLALGACVLSVSSAKIPSPQKEDTRIQLQPDTSVARGGWGSASEFFSGPPAIFFAPVIAVGLIIVLWVAAYNTLRSPPPKIGFGGGAQGGGGGWGWGSANGGWGVSPSGGWAAPAAVGGGWAAAGSEQYETAAGSTLQAATVANAVEQTVAATGQRSLNDLTHRVLTSIERGEQAQH